MMYEIQKAKAEDIFIIKIYAPMVDKGKLGIDTLIVIAVIVGVIFIWRIAYVMRKSTDNLPTLSAIAEMSESEINKILPGHKIS